MADQGDELTPAVGHHLRASHADREHVIDMLKAAFVQGRLARDEFGLRVSQALASQTYADLAALTAGIPAGLTGAQPPEPARKSADKQAVTAVACVSAAWTGVWVPLVVVDGIPSLANLVLVVVLISVVPVSLAGFLLYHARLDRHAGRPSARGLPPGAGGEAPWRPAPADPAGQFPPVGRDLRKRLRPRRSIARARRCPAGRHRIDGALSGTGARSATRPLTRRPCLYSTE